MTPKVSVWKRMTYMLIINFMIQPYRCAEILTTPAVDPAYITSAQDAIDNNWPSATERASEVLPPESAIGLTLRTSVHPESPKPACRDVCHPTCKNLYTEDNCRHACAGRCGQILGVGAPGTGVQPGAVAFTCSCDAQCGVYGDCCSDFKDVCSSEHIQSLYLKARYENTSSCVEPKGNFKHVQMITSCPFDREACNVGTDDLAVVVPIYDTDSGLHFVSSNCAVCNGVVDGIPWNTDIYCLPDAGIISAEPSNITQNHKTLLKDPKCHLSTSPPDDTVVHKCINLGLFINSCPDECSNEELVKSCENGAIGWVAGEIHTYRNIFCALCHKETSSQLKCGEADTPWFEHDLGKFAMSILMDFHPRAGLRIGIKQQICLPGFIKVNGGCFEEVYCAVAHDLNGRCVFNLLHLREISIRIPFTLVTDNSSGYLESLMNNSKELTEIIQDVSKAFLHKSNWMVRSMNISVAINTTVKETISLDIDVDTDIVSKGETAINDRSVAQSVLTKNLTMAIKDELNLFQRISSGGNVSLAVNFFRDRNQITNPEHDHDLNTSQLICNSIRFPNGTFTIQSNNSLLLHITGQMFDENQYSISFNSILICRDLIQQSLGFNIIHSRELGIVSVTAMAISIFCLLIRLILQAIIPSFWTLPMWMQFNLCLTMFISFSLFLIGPLLADFLFVCQCIGVLSHWAFLSVFTWTLLISLDTWMLFKPSNSLVKSTGGLKGLGVYSTVGWIGPFVIVAVSLAMENSEVGTWLKPNYGYPLCWINSKYPLIIFFIVPFITIEVVNFFLFILTAINLHIALRATKSVAVQAQNKRFKIFFKLVILMGTTWVFGLIPPFLEIEALWYVFIILNGLHGVYIFLAFVCTKQVKKDLLIVWRNKAVASRSRKTSSSGLSRSTNLSSSSSDKGSIKQNIEGTIRGPSDSPTKNNNSDNISYSDKPSPSVCNPNTSNNTSILDEEPFNEKDDNRQQPVDLSNIVETDDLVKRCISKSIVNSGYCATVDKSVEGIPQLPEKVIIPVDQDSNTKVTNNSREAHMPLAKHVSFDSTVYVES